MKKFEFLDHPADLKIKAYGKTRKELFSNMMLGMEESLKTDLEEEKDKQEIKIKSLDSETLLVDFLSQILYSNHVNEAVYKDIKFKKFAENELEAEIFGQKVKFFGEEIKAVTYHDLEIIQKNDNEWEATVLFDI